MKKKVYSSYDEIDRDLEILDTERKLHYYKVKRSIDDLKENLALPNLAMGLLDIPKDSVSPLVKKVFYIALPFLIKKAYSLFVKK